MGTRNQLKTVAAGILFGLLGFAGNWFSLELFFNIDFLFGSFFVIFALLRFGPTAGILAGVLAATCTWVLWGHPWAVILLSGEALVLAWRARRPGRDLLTADFLFWVFIGAPLAWLFHQASMGIPPHYTHLIILKQALNGIFNTLLATLTFLLLSAWGHRQEKLPSFRQLVFLAFISLVVLPATGYLIWDLRRALQQEKGELITTVARLSNSVSRIVGQRLDSGGVVDESALRETFDTIIDHRLLHFTLLDRNHEVVLSTRDDREKMTIYTRPDGMIAETMGVFHWLPDPEKGISIMQHWRKSYFFKEKHIGEAFPCTVIVEASAAPMMDFLTREAIDTLVNILLLFLATIGLSHLLSRGFIQTIQALEFASNKLPERLRQHEQVTWPRSGIRELDALSRNFEQMSVALGSSFSSLHALNETLERRVAKRTEKLIRSAGRLRSLFERHQAIMLLVNPATGAILNANNAAAKFYGYERSLLREMQLAQLRASSNNFPADPVNHYTAIHRLAGGEERTMEVYSSILEHDGQKILFAILHDITERQRMEEELRHSKLDWERTFDAVPDLICTLDSHGRILRMNRAMAERLQIDKESAIGQTCFAGVHGMAEQHELCPLIRTIADLRPHSAEIVEEKMDGFFHITTTPVFDPDGLYLGTVHVARDISDAKKLQEQLQFLSLHDELTGLYNRRALDHATEREWRRATRLPQPFSALLLDIDHFKNYNDTWGHLQGDACLKAVATVIQQAVFRAEDFTARYGGEEFVVILPMTTAEKAEQIAERIRLAVEAHEILHPDGKTRSRVTISIGVATNVPVKDTAPTILFQMADQALYAAKAAGRNCVVLHPDNTQLSV